jgi:hypothetical protein
MAVQDARTLGSIVSTGEELVQSWVRLTPLPTIDFRGRVTDERGQAVAGARVEADLYLLRVGRGPYPNAGLNFWLSRPEPGTEWGQAKVSDLVAVTAADGSFVVPRTPAMPRGFRLQVSHPDHATLELTHVPHQEPLQLTLRPGAIVRMRVELPGGTPAAWFRFSLEGEPEGETWSINRVGVTDATGVWEIRALPAGHYTVRYEGGGGGAWAVPAVVFDVGEGEQREVSVTAVEGSVLWGTVCETGTGVPILHAGVRFDSDAYPDTASTFQAAYTDEEGRFEFTYPVAPGPLRLRVHAYRQGKAVGQTHQIVVERQPRTELSFSLNMPKGDAEPQADERTTEDP